MKVKRLYFQNRDQVQQVEDGLGLLELISG
jgi:hypothetical protein